MRTPLIIFGLGWILIWAGIGLLMALQDFGYAGAMQSAADAGNLSIFWATMRAWKIRASTHAHVLNFSYFAIILGLLWDMVKLPKLLKNTAALVYMVGVVVFSFASWNWMQAGMAFGDLAFVSVVALALVGVVREWKDNQAGAE